MKLVYRGHAYDVSAPIQLGLASTEQPQINLIYRSHTYDHRPIPVVVSEAVETDEPVTFIYQSNSYERNPTGLQGLSEAPCHQLALEV